MKFDERGREVPDPTPVEVPARFRTAESTDERIRRLIATAMSNYSTDRGGESIDEANDFDIEGDDPDDTFTDHEVLAMRLEVPDGLGRDATHDAGYPGGDRRARTQRASEDTRGEPRESREDRQEGDQSRTQRRGPGDEEEPRARAEERSAPGRGASPRR